MVAQLVERQGIGARAEQGFHEAVGFLPVQVVDLGHGVGRELERVRGFRFVFGDSGFTFLQVRFQPLLFLQQEAQGILGERCPPLDRITDVFTTNGFREPISHGGIAVCYIEIDQARAATDHRLHHAGQSSGQCLLCRCDRQIMLGRGGRCSRLCA